MKLIRELYDDSEILVETTDTGKKFYVKGITLQSELKNRNGRIYPESTMDKEVNRYIAESVNNGNAWGELDHPVSFAISMKNVSHRFVEMIKEGKNWVSKALIVDTPMGNIVKGLHESGGKIGISSRALGSLKMNNEGVNVVQTDFRLSTAGDIVSDPSGPNCFVDGIMEGVEYFYDEKHGMYVVAEETKAVIKKLSVRQIEEQKVELFKKFLNSVK